MKKNFIFFSLLLLFLPKNYIYPNQTIESDNYLRNGDFTQAIIYLEKSLRNKINPEDKINILLKLSKAYWNIGQIKKSKDLCNQALNLAINNNSSNYISLLKNLLKIHSLYEKGKKHRTESNIKKSKEAFNEAIQIADENNLIEYKIKCLRQLSITELYNENLQEFFKLNKIALKLAKRINHNKEQARCLNNIGFYYSKINNYENAITYFTKALDQFHKIKDSIEISNCLNNIGIIYVYLGNYDKALEYILNALKIDKKLNITNSIISDFNQLGTIYRKKGLSENNSYYLENSIKHFTKALNLLNDTKNENIKIKILNNVGTVYTDLNNNYKALEYFNKALTLCNKVNDQESKGMILNNIGIVYYNLGNYEESTKYYQQAIELALGLQRGEILWEAYLELAKANWKQGNLEEALANYKKSIDIIENIRSQINLEEYRARFLGTDKRIEAYHNLIELMVFLHQSHPEENYDAEAFYFLEKAKARAFLDSLELSKIHLARKINSQLENKEQELLKDISYLYTKILAASTSPEEKQHLQQELVAKEEELESLKREIRASDPAYASLQYPEIIKLHEAQQLLDKKTAFLLYCVDNDQGLGLLLTKKRLNIFSIPDREKLQKLTTNHLLEVTDRNNHTFSAAQKLHSFLIPSYISDNIENLIIIPDDVLLRIPFETLINPKSKKWLIQDFTISYSPSVSSLREIILRRKTNGYKTTKDILAVGDPQFNLGESKEDNGQSPIQSFFSTANINFSPLKYSPLEVKKINNIFKKKSEVYTQAQAKEENIKSLNLSNYKIIHFATHSVIDDKVPARSAIILSLDDDPNEDGFLQMREIYNLHLNADLVTLSACETGLGEFIRGEGIEGINRAFFYAGASAVLMSLWAVNDQATYQLMERFYYHLKNSLPLAKALRKAKLELINSDVLTHPYYWAGFIISGQANKSIFTHSKIKWILVTISGLLLGSAIFISIKRKNGHLKPSH